ncbi:MAG: hypothetical protein HYU64_12205, partial [Armatimonadetes bacterium]|nr:hypothetical protein [Armatimonadota bacterium]
LGGVLCWYLIPCSPYLSHFSRTGKVSVLAGIVAMALLASALFLRNRKET